MSAATREPTPGQSVVPARPELDAVELILLRLVLSGRNLASAATREGLTHDQVTGGRARVLAALGAATLPQAAGIAASRGLVEADEIGIEVTEHPVRLRPRCRWALVLTAQGNSTEATAKAMGISTNTLVEYLREARVRLGTSTLVHAVFTGVVREVLTASDLVPAMPRASTSPGRATDKDRPR